MTVWGEKREAGGAADGRADGGVDGGAERVVVLGTGGTIAGLASTAGDNVGYTAGQVSVSALLSAVSCVDPVRSTGLCLETEQVAQLDSKDMGFPVWQALLARVVHHLRQESVRGVVITHGTDTLEETAFFLHLCLRGSGVAHKPVVLTCAMRPASAQFPDGPQNVADAVAVVGDSQASGVLAVCAGRIHSAWHVQKTHTYRLDAFSSGDAGALGVVEEGRVRWYRPVPAMRGLVVGDGAFDYEGMASPLSWPRVELVHSYAGVTGRLVDLLIQEREAFFVTSKGGAREGDAGNGYRSCPTDGIVVAGTGNGTLHHALESALQRARQAGILVWRTSRCFDANIVDATVVDAAPVGTPFPSQGDLAPVKARVAMILHLLAQGSA